VSVQNAALFIQQARSSRSVLYGRNLEVSMCRHHKHCAMVIIVYARALSRTGTSPSRVSCDIFDLAITILLPFSQDISHRVLLRDSCLISRCHYLPHDFPRLRTRGYRQNLLTLSCGTDSLANSSQRDLHQHLPSYCIIGPSTEH
jgi:hypothetical protein